MGTITKRTGARGTSYQAKVRRAGHPILSKSFPDRRTAELWLSKSYLLLGAICPIQPQHAGRPCLR
jgi:hypothetical protein